MKITITDIQTLQEYQKVKTYELGQPISAVNSVITFPTTLTIYVDGLAVPPVMTFAEFDERVIKQGK